MSYVVKPPLTEAEFLAQVIAFARLHGWRVAHFRPARTAAGWRTPCQADAKGFPDIFALKPSLPPGRQIVVAELKVGRGKVTQAQAAWLDDFRGAGVRTFVWSPESWDLIERVLGE